MISADRHVIAGTGNGQFVEDWNTVEHCSLALSVRPNYYLKGLVDPLVICWCMQYSISHICVHKIDAIKHHIETITLLTMFFISFKTYEV